MSLGENQPPVRPGSLTLLFHWDFGSLTLAFLSSLPKALVVPLSVVSVDSQPFAPEPANVLGGKVAAECHFVSLPFLSLSRVQRLLVLIASSGF